MRTDNAVIVAAVALVAGAGLARLVDRRPVPAACVDALGAKPTFAQTFAVQHFLRGNLHTHTTASDGDSAPEDIARWYELHGYAFLALTDHNVLTHPPRERSDETSGITLLPGEEISMWSEGRQVHVNALCIGHVIAGGTFATAHLALAHAIGETLDQGGVALVNHPNFDWALTSSDVVAADGATLLEIASGHPYVHTGGDDGHESGERLWDDALSAGRDVMGVAVDDMHHLVTDEDPEAFPGVAWVDVFDDLRQDASATREDELCDALRRGALYSSTGARLNSLDVHDDVYAVEPLGTASRVVFVGNGGRELARSSESGVARYRLHGGEGYVRARVESPQGTAWTPAVRVVGDRAR